MKNTANVKRFYTMNLNDGRIILATREVLTNPDYRIVSKALAVAIEAGLKDWRQVAYALRQRDNLDPTALLKRAEQEKVKNLRPSIVTRENVEQFETKLSEEEVGEVYEGDVGEQPEAPSAPAPAPEAAPADEGQPKTTRKATNRGKSSSKKDAAPPAEAAPEAAPADEGNAAPAEELDI